MTNYPAIDTADPSLSEDLSSRVTKRFKGYSRHLRSHLVKAFASRYFESTPNDPATDHPSPWPIATAYNEAELRRALAERNILNVDCEFCGHRHVFDPIDITGLFAATAPDVSSTCHRTMSALFNLFLDICLFRKGPQDVPASMPLLKACLLAYGLSGLLVLLIGTPVPVALLQILLDMVLLGGLLYLALILHRHPKRFEQTLSALTGTGTLMGLLTLPLVVWIARQGAGGDTELPSVLMLALIAWSIAIMAHILRHAFNASIWAGALYALGYTFLSWMLTGWIGPQGG